MDVWSINNQPYQLQHLLLEDIIPLDKELGHGSFGRVFAVKYQGSSYAAKEIHGSLLSDSKENKKALRDNFMRECHHSSLIKHPNIVKFIGVYYAKPSDPRTDLPIMVMELMDTNLTSFIQKNQSNIAMETKLSILHDVSLGLSYLHCHNPAIIHCDLSSYNVLLNSRDHLIAKISDLGTAKIIRINSRERRSMSTTTLGTLHFMPPEALDDKHATYCTPVDVFSFGGIVLHLFSEEWPTPSGFKKRDPTSNKIVSLSEVERRRRYLEEIELAILKEMVMQCLDVDPDQRPSIQEVSKMIKSLKVMAMIVELAKCMLHSQKYVFMYK